MQTLVTDSPEVAASFIRNGQIAAFPTETVYGLGGAVFDPGAIAQIFAAKGRPTDNPLISHIWHFDQIAELASEVTDAAVALQTHFFPGPLTLVLPKHPRVPDVVSAGLPTIGIRMPRHELAQAFLRHCATPVAAPSANVSGRPSPTSWEAVLTDMEGRIPCILRGGRTEAGIESTVVDCTQAVPVVLRVGAVTLEELQSIVPGTQLAVRGDALAARSPGTRHRHYAPRARVVLVANPASIEPGAAYIGLDAPPATPGATPLLLCPDVRTYARELFHFFRMCDAAGVKQIYCQTVEEKGVGRALMDRLTRAAEGSR